METINFKIDLKITTHDAVKENPFVNISLNGYPQFGEILNADTTVEIDVEIEDETTNFLSLEYNNKDPRSDVVVENGVPVADKAVTIQAIYMDDVKLDFHSLVNPSVLSYTSLDPQGENSEGFSATKMFWNGRTTLQFTTPTYLWLLENL